jgi:hypothetical protein
MTKNSHAVCDGALGSVRTVGGSVVISLLGPASQQVPVLVF